MPTSVRQGATAGRQGHLLTDHTNHSFWLYEGTQMAMKIDTALAISNMAKNEPDSDRMPTSVQQGATAGRQGHLLTDHTNLSSGRTVNT